MTSQPSITSFITRHRGFYLRSLRGCHVLRTIDGFAIWLDSEFIMYQTVSGARSRFLQLRVSLAFIGIDD